MILHGWPGVTRQRSICHFLLLTQKHRTVRSRDFFFFNSDPSFLIWPSWLTGCYLSIYLSIYLSFYPGGFPVRKFGFSLNMDKLYAMEDNNQHYHLTEWTGISGEISSIDFNSTWSSSTWLCVPCAFIHALTGFKSKHFEWRLCVDSIALISLRMLIQLWLRDSVSAISQNKGRFFCLLKTGEIVFRTISEWGGDGGGDDDGGGGTYVLFPFKCFRPY